LCRSPLAQPRAAPGPHAAFDYGKPAARPSFLSSRAVPNLLPPVESPRLQRVFLSRPPRGTVPLMARRDS